MKLPLAIVSILVALPATVMCLPEKEESSTPSLRGQHKNDSPRELTILHDGQDAQGRVLLTHNHRKLGKIDVSTVAAAQAGAKGILEGLGAGAGGGSDKFVPKNNNAKHLRFVQVHEGMEIEGAALVVHADADGNVYGVNGERVPTSKIPTTPTIGAGPAIKAALEQSRVPASEHGNCPQIKLTVVRDPKDGSGHLCWACTIRYDVQQADGSFKPFKDKIFAEAAGEPGLVTFFPQIYSSTPPKAKMSVLRNKEAPTLKGSSARAETVPKKPAEKGWSRKLQGTPSMVTEDCNQKTKNCNTVSTSSGNINTGDTAIDSAHNYAIATYEYFYVNHGLDSIDGNGMDLISRVHYDRNYNNAFWDGTQMTYGDGDGTTFVPLSQDADVVAHELTHGVTERSSGLIYQNESGALNEAWSDIFGALVDRQEGALGPALWLLGEDIYTPGTPDDGLRNMADPVAAGDYDWWPTRYTGTSDNGGVHWNSGIANLAFSLLVGMVKEYNGVNGLNRHPRGKSSIEVPIIGWTAAADAFYQANVACLTPGSNFAMARYCTADVFGGANAATIHLAWDAVGVPNDPPPPPAPPTMIDDSVPLSDQVDATGNMKYYKLSTTISEGSKVQCTTTGSNGDADLYLRFNDLPEANPNSLNNECGSYSSNSNEDCTTGEAPAGDNTFYALVHAYDGYANLSIECHDTLPGNCDPAGSPCGNCCNGCEVGGPPSSRVCL